MTPKIQQSAVLLDDPVHIIELCVCICSFQLVFSHFPSCFSGHKRMWTSTNYFLVNLSFTDLLMTILNGLFNFIYMRDNDWPFGSVYCTINNFVAYYTVIASVLTLTAITLDRYVTCVSCSPDTKTILKGQIRFRLGQIYVR